MEDGVNEWEERVSMKMELCGVDMIVFDLVGNTVCWVLVLIELGACWKDWIELGLIYRSGRSGEMDMIGG